MTCLPPKWRIAAIASAMAALTFTTAWADSIETQSNPVAAGTMAVAPGNNDRSDWIGVPSYQLDPVDTGGIGVDYTEVQIANDDTNLYFHFLLAAPDPPADPLWFGSKHNVYIDTDQDRSTGFIGGGGFLSLGAEYLFQGSTLFEFTGVGQEDWAWNQVGVNPYDDFPTTDIETLTPLASLGDPVVFDFIISGANWPDTDDYYPDHASSGALGDYFSYIVDDAPNPLGDFNLDGNVDAADLTLWETGFGMTGAAGVGDGDADGDGDVDGNDFLLWQRNFGIGASASVAAVPEPTTAVLVCLFGCAWVVRRWAI